MSRSVSCRVVPVESLVHDEMQAWLELQSRNPQFASPCYHPKFTEAVASVRGDVRVVVAERDGKLVAFLPLQFSGARQVEPVGGRLNDFHGMICARDFEKSVGELLKLAGLGSWTFHALMPVDQAFEDQVICEQPSPILDLSNGYSAYQTEVCRTSSTIKRQGQKTRRLARDVGPIRFELSTGDPFLLEHLITMKRERYARTRAFDVLSVEWCANLLRQVSQISLPDFQGFVSALWAGDRIVATHVGMMTPTVLHYWFPAYDLKYGRYSPGTILLQETARAAADLGIKTVDLSYGPDSFKYKASNGSRTVASGVIDSRKLGWLWRRTKLGLRDAVKRTPCKERLKRVGRTVFPNYGQGEYR